jgi:hypothetical protein
MNGRNVRYVGAELRRMVWRDVEVCEALLAADEDAVWTALVADLRRAGAEDQVLNLLDVVSAVSFEQAVSAEPRPRSA